MYPTNGIQNETKMETKMDTNNGPGLSEKMSDLGIQKKVPKLTQQVS